VIKVGGHRGRDEGEEGPRRRRLHATRAAVEEGIVPGGGTALLYGKRALKNLKPANRDQEVGIEIIGRALEAPIRQIAYNAGVEGSIVVGKLSEQKEANFGYDAQKDKYCDLVSAGIIDPVKVVRTALQGAASVAGLMITTEATIAELPKKEEPHMHGGHGDMGGMGGMGGMM
jgi:chaperonin GroEL